MRADSGSCDRARAWASLRLDGEISELEEALLQSHLRRCPSCSEYAESVRGAVLALRAQPLEQLDHPIVVAGRRRVAFRPGAVARVAAVAAAVIGVTTVLSTQSAKGPTAPVASAATAAAEDTDLEQLRTLRVLQLGGRPPRDSGIGSFGPVLTRQLRPPS